VMVPRVMVRLATVAAQAAPMHVAPVARAAMVVAHKVRKAHEARVAQAPAKAKVAAHPVQIKLLQRHLPRQPTPPLRPQPAPPPRPASLTRKRERGCHPPGPS